MAAKEPTNLWRMRDMASLSQRQLAQRANVALATIQKMEHGERTHAGSRQKVAQALGVPAVALAAPWPQIEALVTPMIFGAFYGDGATPAWGAETDEPAAPPPRRAAVVVGDEDDEEEDEDAPDGDAPGETEDAPEPAPRARRRESDRAPSPAPVPARPAPAAAEPVDDGEDPDAEMAAGVEDDDVDPASAENVTALMRLLPDDSSNSAAVQAAADGIKQWLAEHEGQSGADGKTYLEPARVEELISMWVTNAADAKDFAAVLRRARRIAGIRDSDNQKGRR